MLQIDVSKIPDEGLDLEEALTPADIHVQGLEDFRLAEGGRVACHVERGDEDTVHLTGRLEASVGLDCGRCLEPFAVAFDQPIEVFYLLHKRDLGQEDEVELTERDMVVAYYAGHTIDLGETLREQLYLGLPMKGLCRQECRGLCPTCGTNRNREACDCRPPTDPRLSSLGGLLGR